MKARLRNTTHLANRGWLTITSGKRNTKARLTPTSEVLKFRDQLELLEARDHLRETPWAASRCLPYSAGATPFGNFQSSWRPKLSRRMVRWTPTLLTRARSVGAPYIPAFVPTAQKLYCTRHSKMPVLLKVEY